MKSGPEAPPAPNPERLAASPSWPGVVLAVVAFCVYLGTALRFPLHGIWHDDALYVQLGRSIASGSYRLEQLPTAPLQTRYPPLFPAILSLVALAGADPRTHPFAYALPGAVLAALGAFAWYRLFARRHSAAFALLVSALAALAPGVVVTSGTALSEPVIYLLLPLFLGASARARNQLGVAGCGGLAAAMVLTRLALIPAVLLAAIGFAKAFGWRGLVTYLLPIGIAGAAWALFTGLHSTDTARAYEYYQSYTGALSLELRAFGWNRLGDIAQGSGAQLLGALWFHEIGNWLGAAGRSCRDGFALGSTLIVFAYLLVRHLRSGVGTGLFVAGVLLSCLPTWWPTWRYVLPVLPLFIESGVILVHRLLRSRPLRTGLAVVFLASTLGSAAWMTLRDQSVHADLWSLRFPVADYAAAAEFVARELPTSAVLATDVDPWLHLATGRKCLGLSKPRPELALRPERWDSWLVEEAQSVVADWKTVGVTHLLTTPGLAPWHAAMLDQLEARGRLEVIWRGRTPGWEVCRLRL